ncbi:MAG TPA: hypothetical protein VKU92_07500 [Acidimicrobiales bacterium]|nr:hypothetical protein [Acidimicrobiales bacterium]
MSTSSAGSAVAPRGEALLGAEPAPASTTFADRVVTTRQIVWWSLGLFALGRVLLLLTASAISASDHLGVTLILRSWDGRYYMYLTHWGYPTTTRLLPAKPDAFFPLYPILSHLTHEVTRLPWLDSAIAVSWVGGGALVVVGALLARSVWGPERALQAAMLLAVFPGSVVSGLPYADPLGLALAAGCLLLCGRHRYGWAALAAFGATLTFSLALAPLCAVSAWLFFFERRRKALVVGAAAGLGALSFWGYLWWHVGTPLIWFRLERVKWHSGFGVSLTHGTIWALRSNVYAGTITAACLLVAVAGLVWLWQSPAPRTWVVFAGTVFAISMLDKGTWLTPRLLYAMFPAMLAVGARIRAEWRYPMVVISLLCLCLCLAIYAPQNWIFFNP